MKNKFFTHKFVPAAQIRRLRKGMVIQMKMKRIMITILSFALMGAVVAGCGENRQSRQDTQQDVPQSISQVTQQDPIDDKTGEETVEKETA